MRRRGKLRFLLVHDLNHVDAAASMVTDRRPPKLLTQNVKVRHALAERGIECEWALPAGWAPDNGTQRALTEEFLAITYNDFGHSVAHSFGLWRRANHFRFLHVVTALMAARECVQHLRLTIGNLRQVGVLVNPDYFTTLHAYLPGSAFVFLLKALAPEISYLDFRTGQVLSQGSVLGLKVGVNPLESTPAAELSEADVVVLPVAIKDRWQDFVEPEKSVATVATVFLGSFDYTLGASIQPPDAPMPLAEISTEPTISGLLALYRPVLTQVWMPLLHALKDDCAEFLLRVRPSEIIVCDHTFPESAFLADARSDSTKLVVLSHDVAGVDVSLWEPEPGLIAYVGTETARRKWAKGGTQARLDSRCFSALRSRSPARVSRSSVAPLRILVVGTGDHIDGYPLVPPEFMARSLPAVLNVPVEQRDDVELRVKPRPGQKTSQQYRRFTDINAMIPEDLPLPVAFLETDIAVVVEQTSAAVVEAIGAGCAVLAVGCDAQSQAWNRTSEQSGLFNAKVIPVLKPEEFWPTISAISLDCSEIDGLRERQLNWLSAEFSVGAESDDVDVSR